ncbi:hypothetical protein L1765_02465 [Microaerobacter geothermalis]|uniref:DUF3892 domain-containing protein n=1 Tax=Microaerobacter geothermalis TaxID=674972 RepID=UPI001F163C90|nr:DUF3892 domain-containing protein [Microaerobacter geothermalis]MCF6092860.1 hypothetical protein [Microaerobacter geothermalis]
MGVKLVAVRKDTLGNITHFLTNTGKVISINQAVKMAHDGQVDSITDLHADGTWSIQMSDETVEGSNLTFLPEF